MGVEIFAQDFFILKFREKLHAEGDRKAQNVDDVELNKLYNKQQTTEGTYVTYKST